MSGRGDALYLCRSPKAPQQSLGLAAVDLFHSFRFGIRSIASLYQPDQEMLDVLVNFIDLLWEIWKGALPRHPIHRRPLTPRLQNVRCFGESSVFW
jgi:hypothetical protein